VVGARFIAQPVDTVAAVATKPGTDGVGTDLFFPSVGCVKHPLR